MCCLKKLRIQRRKGGTQKTLQLHWTSLVGTGCRIHFWLLQMNKKQPDNYQLVMTDPQSCSACLANMECSRELRHCRRKKSPTGSLHSQLRDLETSSVFLQGTAGMLVDQEKNSYGRLGMECKQQMKQNRSKKNRQGNHHQSDLRLRSTCRRDRACKQQARWRHQKRTFLESSGR